MWNDRQAIEIFHLLFLRAFGARVDKALFALKGGCNLRFFLKSIRYSKTWIWTSRQWPLAPCRTT
jgi:hypothetical protein